MKKLIYLASGLLAASLISLQPASAAIDAPRAFVVEGGDTIHSLRLLWVNPDSASLDHINVYLSALPLTEFGLMAAVTGVQAQSNQRGEYTIAGLADLHGTDNYYYLYLVAVDKSGNKSPATATLKRQTGSSWDVSGTDPVSALTATTVSSTSLRLNWTNPAQDDLYQIAIYRSTDSSVLKNDANFVTRQTVLPSAAGTFTNIALSPDTTYYYRVVTEDVKGNVSEPTITSGKTLKAPIVPPVITPPVVTPAPPTPPVVINPWKFDYRAQWISQSGTLSADKKAHEVYGTAGQELTLTLTLKNTGKAWWYPTTPDSAHVIKLGTWMPQDNTSPLKANTWLTSNRIVQIDSVTGTGSTYTFKFKITIPTNAVPGMVYKFYVRPVAEYVKWFGPTGIFWNLVVS